MSDDREITVISWQGVANRNWFLGFGIVSVMLGVAAIIFPFVAALAIEQIIGWILVISGLVGVAHGFQGKHLRTQSLSVISSIFALGIGVMLVVFPGVGILSLAVLVALFFIASGISRIAMAWRLRPLDRWLWLMLSGLLSLLFALLLLALGPGPATWVIGILLGFDLLASGIILILLALTARKEPHLGNNE